MEIHYFHTYILSNIVCADSCERCNSPWYVESVFADMSICVCVFASYTTATERNKGQSYYLYLSIVNV